VSDGLNNSTECHQVRDYYSYIGNAAVNDSVLIGRANWHNFPKSALFPCFMALNKHYKDFFRAME